MSEKIFSGFIRINVVDNATRVFKGLAEVVRTSVGQMRNDMQVFDQATGGFLSDAFSIGKSAADEFFQSFRENTDQAKNSAEAFKIAMAASKPEFRDLASEARLAFEHIASGGGSVRMAISGLSAVLAEVLGRFEKSEGAQKASKFFGAVTDAVEKTHIRFTIFDSILGSTEKNFGALLERAALVTGTLRTQTVAWKAHHEAMIRTQRQTIRLLKAFLNLDMTMEGATEAGGKIVAELEKIGAFSPEMFSRLGAGDLAKQLNEVGFSAEFAENMLVKTSDSLETSVGVQRGLIVRTIGSMSELRTSVRYLQTTWEAQGEISERYLERARRAVEDLKPQMRRLARMHGEVPEEMIKSYKEAVRIMHWAEAQQKIMAYKGVRGRFKLIKDYMTGAYQATEKYQTEVKKATSANRMLLNYVRPSGVMHRGMVGVREDATAGAKAAHTFSLSLGSVVGMAGAMGGALGQIDPAFSTLIVGLSRLADQFIRSFTAMMNISGTFGQKVTAALRIASSSFMAFGLIATGVIVKAGMLGAEVKTLDITMRQIAKNLANEAGVNAVKFEKYIVKLRDSIKGAGIETREATNSLTLFLRAKLPVAHVEELAEAAKNLGVTVANMSTSEVLGRFIYFIQSGNTALLQALGITKTAAQMNEDYAKSIDSSAAALSPMQKQLARIMGLIQQVESSQGVYNEAMKTAGKQLSSMKRHFHEATLVLGSRWEPMLYKVILGMNRLLEAFYTLPPYILDNIAAVVKWTAVWGTGLGVILSLAPAIRKIIPLIKTLGISVLKALPWLIALAAAVGGLIAIVKALRKAWENNVGGIRDAILNLVHVFKRELAPVFGWLSTWMARLKEDFEEIVTSISTVLTKWVTDVADAMNKGQGRIWDFMQNVIAVFRGLFDALHHIMQAIKNMILGDTDAAANEWHEALVSALAGLKILFETFVAQGVGWGFNLISGFAKGMAEAARIVVGKVAELIGVLIGSFFKGASPPKKGPLQHIAEWGRGVMDEYLRGFGLADFSSLKNIMSPIQGALEDAVLAGTFGKDGAASMIPLLQNVRKQVAHLLSDFRKTGTVNQSVMAGISNALGEGGRDLMEYIRLMLSHQKALRNLEKVQAKVAEAEEAGFVPKDLKDELTAAEAQAKAVQDQLKWQKELLAAQRDGISLQLKMLTALEKVADRVGRKGKGETPEEAFKLTFDEGESGGLLNALKDIGAQAVLFSTRFEGAKEDIEKFLDLDVEGKLSAGMDWLLGLFSLDTSEIEGWEEMTFADRIGALFDEAILYVQTNAPIWASQIADVAIGFLEAIATGFETGKSSQAARIGNAVISILDDIRMQMWQKWMEKTKENINAYWENIKGTGEMAVAIKAWFSNTLASVWEGISGWATGLYDVVAEWVSQTIGRVGEGIGAWATNLKDSIAEWFDKAMEFLRADQDTPIASLAYWIGAIIGGTIKLFTETIPEKIGELADVLADWFNEAALWLLEDLPVHAANLLEWIIGIIDATNTLLTETLPEKVKELAIIVGQWLLDTAADLLFNAPTYAAALFGAIQAISDEAVKFLVEDAPKLLKKFMDWMRDNIILPFAAGILEHGPEWLGDMVKAGVVILDKLKEGILGAFPAMFDWFKLHIIQPLVDLLPFSEPKDRSSPMYGLGRSGEAFWDNWLKGAQSVDVSGMLAAKMKDFSANVNGMDNSRTYNNSYAFGAGAMTFPNMTRSEDALGFMEILNERVGVSRAKSYIGA